MRIIFLWGSRRLSYLDCHDIVRGIGGIFNRLFYKSTHCWCNRECLLVYDNHRYSFTLHDDGDVTAYTVALACPGDFNGDGEVNLVDLACLLGNYGSGSGMTYEDGDFDEDGNVDLADLAALLGVYGTTCE